MYQQERLNTILEILKKHNYVTVDYLVEEVCYSPSSIRRDLTMLEKQGLVKRSYGGVELAKGSEAPFAFRSSSMQKEKTAIARAAAKLVKDGDTVFLGTSSISPYIAELLIEKKDVKVVCPNLSLSVYLAEKGMKVYTTCGKIMEKSGLLTGALLRKSLELYDIDIGFISDDGFTSDGYFVGDNEAMLGDILAVRKNCKVLAGLCTGDKFKTSCLLKSLSAGDVEYFISDIEVDRKLKEKYKDTVFICAAPK